MFDDWTKTETWHHEINGICFTIRKTRAGKFEWHANRNHPGLDEWGWARTIEQAMDAASSVAE